MCSDRRNARAFAAAGFSLVEMMVVFVLLGLLSALVTVNVRGSLVKGKQNAARAAIARLSGALEQFQIDESRYPTNSEGLRILTTRSPKRPEPLLPAVPTDPWGRAYQYNAPGRNNQPFEIICFGADGKEGGDGADADIATYNLEEMAK
jgi:general secretion pathway protein G